MFTAERKLWTWVEKHLHMLLFLFFSLMGLMIRVSLRYFSSDDAGWYLLPWYDTIVEQGQIKALSSQVGNYNILYQFLIAIMTYLPVEALYAYKILSCLFDYLLALAAGYLTGQTAEKGKRGKALAAYAAVLLSPAVFANSAVWAQCDSIYTFWILVTMVFLMKEKYARAFVCYGIAAAFKLQAVFFFPFLLFYYVYSKRFTILYFGIIPVVMCISGIPGFIMGRPLWDIIRVYLEQTDTYTRLSSGYPSFWNFFSSSGDSGLYYLYKVCAILFTVCVLAAWMAFWAGRKIEMTPSNTVYMAFILVYTTVLFLPAMHERYGYVYEILAVLIAFLNLKTIPLLGVLVGLAMFSYGSFLHYRPVNYDIMAIVNCIVYGSYCLILTKQMRQKA